MENNNKLSNIFCSFTAETNSDKAKLYNALSNPEVKISDHIGNKIEMRDVIIETIEITDKKTGETKNVPRVIIIDRDGHSYVATSNGIYNAIMRIFALYGEPTWEECIPVIVRQMTIGANRVFTLDIAF